MRKIFLIPLALLLFPLSPLANPPTGGSGTKNAAPTSKPTQNVPPEEVGDPEAQARQLTFVGNNGEAYFSPDGLSLIFQSNRRPEHCHYQLYILDLVTGRERRIIHHNGDNTCAFFHPKKPNLILFSSTKDEIKELSKFKHFDPRVFCQKKRNQKKKKGQKRRYRWAYKPYEIYLATADGKILRRLTHAPGYDAEASFSPDGQWIVFSSRRDGDQELYAMRSDGTGQRRLTWRPGNDGGPFFSPDGKKITWRSFDRRGNAQVFVADFVNGKLKNIRQLTYARGIHWAPYWHPSGKWIVFSANFEVYPKNAGNFDLYLIDVEGKCLQKLTRHPAADVLPVFSPDGKWIAFTSRRAGGSNSHIFIMPFKKPSKCVDPKKFFHPSRVIKFGPPARTDRSIPLYHYYRNKKFKKRPNYLHYYKRSQKQGSLKPKYRNYRAYGKNYHRAYGKSYRHSPPSHAPTTKKNPKLNLSKISKILGDIYFLTHPLLQGRDAGSRGIELAAQFIAQRFRSLGLKPFGDNGTYFQTFSVTTGVELAKTGNYFETKSKKSVKKWEVKRDFMPFGFSSNGSVDAPVVFAGYGISADKLNYDDYKGLNVRGKAVLIFRYTPRWYSKGHPWGDKRNLYAEFRYKILNARIKGAKAVLIVDPPAPLYKRTGKGAPRSQPPATAPAAYQFAKRPFVKLGFVRGLSDAGLPALHISTDAAAHLVGGREKLMALWKKIERKLKPYSLQLQSSVNLSVKLEKTKAAVKNVVALLPGTERKYRSEYIVVGAHYDHLGYGRIGAFPGNLGKLHPGADDNSSGTASVLALAEYFSKHRPRRNIIFIAFAAEERGLLGSAHFVKNPPVPLKQIAAMVNLDMVGRLRKNTLQLNGVGTAAEFPSVAEKAARATSLRLKVGTTGYGPSDHSSFYSKKIPVFFLFTGVHRDYHRPTDTYEKLNFDGLLKIIRFAAHLIDGIDSLPKRPQFKLVKTKFKLMVGKKRRRRGGMRVSLGTIPDYSGKPRNDGVLLMGVRPGSPAHKAGLKGGDLLIQLGKYPIRNLYDLVIALRDYSPYQKVKAVVLRDGKKLEFQVTLEPRYNSQR